MNHCRLVKVLVTFVVAFDAQNSQAYSGEVVEHGVADNSLDCSGQSHLPDCSTSFPVGQFWFLPLIADLSRSASSYSDSIRQITEALIVRCFIWAFEPSETFREVFISTSDGFAVGIHTRRRTPRWRQRRVRRCASTCLNFRVHIISRRASSWNRWASLPLLAVDPVLFRAA